MGRAAAPDVEIAARKCAATWLAVSENVVHEPRGALLATRVGCGGLLGVSVRAFGRPMHTLAGRMSRTGFMPFHARHVAPACDGHRVLGQAVRRDRLELQPNGRIQVAEPSLHDPTVHRPSRQSCDATNLVTKQNAALSGRRIFSSKLLFLLDILWLRGQDLNLRGYETDLKLCTCTEFQPQKLAPTGVLPREKLIL